MNYKIEIKNIYKFLDDLDYSKKFVTILDIMYKYNLLFSLYNKDYKYFICSFLDSVKVLDNIDFNPYERNANIYINVNSLNNCLFLIKDLEGFIGNIKENIKVNQGP